jgi:large subunit ribosomal protein L23
MSPQARPKDANRSAKHEGQPGRAAIKHNSERLATVLLAPIISEKGTFIGDKHNQIIFRIVADATKPEVKAAVETMLKVEVKSVQIVNVGGKTKRFGRFTGRRRGWKKAYVCLKPGQEVNFAAEA